MRLLEPDRELLRFTLNTPVLEVLFHLPPQIGKRNSLFPKRSGPDYRSRFPLFCAGSFPPVFFGTGESSYIHC